MWDTNMWFVHRNETEYMFSNHEEYVLSSPEERRRVWADGYLHVLVMVALSALFHQFFNNELVTSPARRQARQTPPVLPPRHPRPPPDRGRGPPRDRRPRHQ